MSTEAKSRVRNEKLVVDMNVICRTDGTLPIIDYNDFESTMSTEEYRRIMKAMETCRERQDWDGYDEHLSKVPLSPHIAIGMLYERGVTDEDFLEYNLADVEKYFGKDWKERFRPQASEKSKKAFGRRGGKYRKTR